ncbi:MAG: deoxyribonuclease V [Gemmatales bacterium]|nr:deoxyribonuclease V [Gemmatales bacterium]MDW7993742.1 deoxyribonuclease V [Gemmatales bacterium]
MKPTISHPWNVSPREAIALQHRLASLVKLQGRLDLCRYVAGADVAYTRSRRHLVAAVVLWCMVSNQVVEHYVVRQTVRFPYVPGLLSFRESPAILEALQLLRQQPDLLMIDGHGYAHPRRFGIACHLGVLFDLPAIGCAKSLLVGEHEEVPDVVGAWVPVSDHEQIIGAALRTRLHVRPVYVSIGHKLELEQAITWTLRCCRGYRLPEPTRQAHILVTRARTQGG